jgi:5-hydroxyisourate hydrolase
VRIFTRLTDNTYGKGAVGVRGSLARMGGSDWVAVSDAETRDDGRIEEWEDQNLERGLYRIVFDTGGYFASLGMMAISPEIVIIFRMPSEFDTFRVELMLSPYSYSTYFTILNNMPDVS